MQTVSILGTEYTIEVKKYGDDEIFKRRNIDGFCDSMAKQIVVCDMTTWPEWEHEPENNARLTERETLRHEIIHAFFNESGLMDSTNMFGSAWAKNEEMVDWFAVQGPKIYEAWRSAGAL